MADIQELIQKLNSFGTRKAAKTRLIEMGEDGVDALSLALTGPMRDNVKWNVIDILAQIGSPRALPGLRTCALDPTFETVCSEAIFAISGERPDTLAEEGPVPAAQEPPAEHAAADAAPSEKTPRNAPPPRAVPPPPAVKPENGTPAKIVTAVIEKTVEVEKKPLTPDEVRVLLEDLFEKQGYENISPITEGARQTGYKFTVKTDKDRRRQNIHVMFNTTDEDGRQIMVLYSICCEATKEYYEAALRWNQNIASGSICLTDIKGKPHFILLKHLALNLATPDAVREIIKHLAERADQIEKVLTGAEDIR